MKIVGVDNLNRETVADVLVAENVSDRYAEHMAKGLNDALCPTDGSSRFFRAMPDDYRLSRGMEDLV